MENTDEELTNDRTEEVEEELHLIDPNDLIIIDDPDNYKPTEEMILAYAVLLGYDPEKDPKELLEIAEKYLTCKIPDNITRAFMRTDYRILYIDMNTQEITLDSDLEIKAKEEFEEYRKNPKPKPPINNVINNTDEELKKKLEEQNDSLRNSQENIQIIDEPEEEEMKEEKKEEKKEEDKNEEKNNLIEDKNKSKDKEESSSEDFKKNIINNEFNNNIENKKEEQKIEQEDDGFFDESSKSSKDINDYQKEIKSKKFVEDIKEEKIIQKKDDIINIMDTSSKKYKNLSKGKYLNKDNSDEDIFNKNKSKEKDETEEKKEYLEKTKKNLEKYIDKLKKDYINKKNVFIEKNSDRIYANLKRKKTLEMSEVNLDELDYYESSLKQKMELELEKYKNNLILNYESDYLNQTPETDVQKYELKKKKLESDIRIQKERNKNKKDNEVNKNKNLIEDKKNHFEELTQTKKSRLITKHKDDINKLQKEFQDNLEAYIKDFRKNDLNNKNNNDDESNELLKNNLKELEEEYIKELNEQFEQEKISISYQLEANLLKDLEIFKNQERIKKEQEIKKINGKMDNLGNEYFNEKNLIKKQLDLQKEKADSIINEKIKNINSFFSEIKKKFLNRLSEEMKQVNKIIKNNYRSEDDEIKVEEQLIDKFVVNNSKLNEVKSMYDLTEKDYNEIKMKIEYISRAISDINKLLIEKGSNNFFEFNLEDKNKNKDDLLVNEMILTIQDKFDEFKNNNKDNINNKLYPFLEEEINDLMENIRKSKENNIRRNNNYYFSKNGKPNNNIFNDYNFEKSYPQMFNNDFNSSNKFRKSTKKSFSTDKSYKNYYNNNIMNNSIEENGSSITRNNMSENNMELSQEMLNNFPEDLLYLYDKIISFIKEESSQIEKDKQSLKSDENINNTLRNLKDSDNFKSYQKDLNFIFSQEQRNSRNKKANIESKIKLFERIKSFWEETIYYIYNHYSSPDTIKKKLNTFIQHINDYKSLHHSNQKNTFDNKMYNISFSGMNNLGEKKNFNLFNCSDKNNLRYEGNNYRNSPFDRYYI